MKKYSITTLIILCCMSLTALAEINKKRLTDSVEREAPDNLYIMSAKDIDKMKTVTYYVTQSNPRNDLVSLFYDYAKSIGDTNGAVVINMKDRVVLKNQDKEYLKYLEKMCKIPESDELPAIIFEHKHRKKCLTFKRVNGTGFDKTIASLLKNDLKDKEKSEIKSELKLIVDDAIKSFPTLKDNELAFRDLIDFIVN